MPTRRIVEGIKSDKKEKKRLGGKIAKTTDDERLRRWVRSRLNQNKRE
jgi:hypothetical protein